MRDPSDRDAAKSEVGTPRPSFAKEILQPFCRWLECTKVDVSK